MTELLAFIAPLLLVDVLNPVLFAVLIFAAGSDRPVANSSAMLLGHTLAYFIVGIGDSYGLEEVTHRLDNPKSIDFLVEALIGVACLYAALASRKGGASKERTPEGVLTPLKCFGYGAIINFVGAPFALPYLAVVGQILEADLALTTAVAVLVGYNIAYALPFTFVPGLIAVMGDRARPLLDKVNHVMERGADILMPWLMLAIGLWLIADVVTFVFTGAPI